MLKPLVFDAYGTLFDVCSVLERCEEVFPGHGPDLTTIWRTKQLQYTWLRSLMGKYDDFWQVTQDGLEFACRSLSLAPSQEQIDYLMQAYLSLSPFPEIAAALDALIGVSCSILSNGSPTMLQNVVQNAGLEGRFQSILSVDEVRIYKPSPVVYQKHLGIDRQEISFVSSNCWDVAGGKAFGFRAYWLNREKAPIESLGFQPDGVVHSATELASVLK
jgi:2-haloacid dehalogenase